MTERSPNLVELPPTRISRRPPIAQRLPDSKKSQRFTVSWCSWRGQVRRSWLKGRVGCWYTSARGKGEAAGDKRRGLRMLIGAAGTQHRACVTDRLSAHVSAPTGNIGRHLSRSAVR